MNPQQVRLSAMLTVWLAIVGALLLPTADATNESPSVQITGDYRYAYHDPETATHAQDFACREALRLAIGAAAPVREQIGSVVDPSLFRQVVQMLATRHVTDYHAVEQFQKGHTVYCKVRGMLQPEAVQQVLEAQGRTALDTQGSTASQGELDRNRALQIVAVEEQDGTIVVTYQTLRRLDWGNTAYAGSLQGLADVMVDFYDGEGVLIRTYRHPARQTSGGDDVMQPGQIGVLKVPKPLHAKSYRVWLVK
ncbi:MAG TPA: hypothetical protein VFG71_11170 [Nitrospiraceae bacterium]|nr:hypothetical protein [Nitrospiraceae bacterium]